MPDSKAKEKMNENPEFASNWKGRVLCQVVCEETKDPQTKVEMVPEAIVEESRSFLKPKRYEVIAEVGQAIALPEIGKYTVRILIGGHVLQTDKPKSEKRNSNRFN